MNPTPAKADEEPSLRDKYFQEIPQIAMVHFDFDSVVLRPEAREILKRNSDVLAKHPGWAVLVEGHCDERGTIAYNLGWVSAARWRSASTTRLWGSPVRA